MSRSGALPIVWAVSVTLVAGQSSLLAQEPEPAGAGETFTAEALREDFAILRAAFEEGHPGIYRYSTKPEIDARFDMLARTIAIPLSDLEFLKIVSFAAGAVNDGHTRVQPSQELASRLAQLPIRLPFKLQFLGGEAYLHRNYSDLDDSYLGARVRAINGTPMKDIVQAVLPLMPSDGRVLSSKYRRLDSSTSFGPLYSLAFGLTTH